MSTLLSDTISFLRSDSETEVTQAATRLGLLLERGRFRRRGTGTLGDVDAILGDLVDTVLSPADEVDVLIGLRAHLGERGPRANPTVIWAIGKALDEESLGLVADVAAQAMDDPEQGDVVRQALVTISATAPGAYKDLFLRASREAAGDLADFAAQQVSIHGWS